MYLWLLCLSFLTVHLQASDEYQADLSDFLMYVDEELIYSNSDPYIPLSENSTSDLSDSHERISFINKQLLSSYIALTQHIQVVENTLLLAFEKPQRGNNIVEHPFQGNPAYFKILQTGQYLLTWEALFAHPGGVGLFLFFEGQRTTLQRTFFVNSKDVEKLNGTFPIRLNAGTVIGFGCYNLSPRNPLYVLPNTILTITRTSN